MSAPGTPKISPVRVSCRANLLASADLAVCRDNDLHRSGEVGRFLDIAPFYCTPAIAYSRQQVRPKP